MSAADGGEQRPLHHPERRTVRLTPDVEEGDLADDRGDVRVRRRRGQRIAASQRRAEVATRRGSIPGASGRRRSPAPVLELASGEEEVALAAAVAETAVVEDQGGEARCGKALGERAKQVAPRAPAAVGHRDDRDARGRRAGRPVQPSRVGVAADVELEVLPCHAQTTGGRGKT